MASKLKFMLPYFSFIVKYFSRGNSGVMPDYFYRDINKIEVRLVILSISLEVMWDVIQAEKNTSKIDCRLQLVDHCTENTNF